ncbi:MAG: branched-chain amino acid transaminase [archaeon]
MEETEYIWMDGDFVPWKEARVHVLSHTLHYGMGVFEGIRFYETEKGPAIFRLQDHTTRLFSGARDAFLEIPYSQEEINQAIIYTVRKNQIKSGYVRPLAFFGYGKMGLNPRGAPTNVAIAVWPWGAYLGDGEVRVKTSHFMRIHPASTLVEAKICGHYVNSIFASCEAKDSGYDEALLLDDRGYVAEGPGENIFIIKNESLLTPTVRSILQGITRKSVMEIAVNENLDVQEKDLKVQDVYDANEAFFTGTAAEITAITSVDDNVIGNGTIGPITRQLKNVFMNATHGRDERYRDWLTIV